MVCYNMTVERVKLPASNKKFNLGELLKSLVTNKALCRRSSWRIDLLQPPSTSYYQW